jgi:hypothetical protein
MEHGEGRRTPLMMTEGDSSDTRLFIELSSYGSDLSEAHHALDLAIQGNETDSPAR